jgi:hypothetical protein
MRFLNDILIEAGLIVNGTVQIDSIPAAVTDTDKFMVSDGGVMKSRTGAQVASDIDAMTKAVYDTDGDGIVDDAEKVTVIARNSTGSTIYKGTIVYLSGSTGNRPNMLKAQANSEPTSSKTFGVVVADVANNADGEVAALGTLHDLDTRSGAPNPFTSDTLVDGDALWLSPATAGYVTRTKPTAPNHAVFIGIVARTSPTNGRIVYRIQNGYELEELHNVSALTPNNNDGIFYNSTTGLWEAKSIATAAGGTIGTVTSVAMTVPTGLQIGGSPITTSGTLALTYATGYAIPTTVKQSNWDDAYTWVSNFPTQTGNSGKYLTTDGNALSWATVTAGISGSGTTNYLAKWASASSLSNSLVYDDGTNLSIGSTNPFGYKLNVEGTVRFGAPLDGSVIFGNQGNSYPGISLNGTLSTTDYNFTSNATDKTLYINSPSGHGIKFRQANTEKMFLSGNGNLLIGTTTDAGFMLDVNGNSRIVGKVNIGNLSNIPSPVVDILAGNTTAGLDSGLRLRHSGTDGNTMTINLGVSNTAGGGDNQGHGYIQAVYWGGTVNNPIFINPKSSVGIVINHDSYGASTIIAGNSIVAQGSMLIKPASNTNSGVIKGYGFAANAYNAGGGSFSSGMYGQFAASSWQNGIDLVFITISGPDVTGSEGVERLRIKNTGEVSVSNLSGTGSRMVVADSSGVLSTQAIPSGGASGSGTTNYIPKWTGTTSLGNSLIQDDGTSVGVNNSPSASGMLSVNRGALTESIILTSSDATNRIRFQNTGNTQIGIIQFDSNGFGVGCGGGYLSAITVGRTTNHVGIFGSPDASFRLNIGGTFKSSGDANINGLTVGKGGGQLANNTAFGFEAINATNTGTGGNTAFGYQALRAVTSGEHNAGFGWQSGLALTTGSYNYLYGYRTGRALTTGSGNVMIGYGVAEYSSNNVNYNILIGYAAGQGYFTTTGNNTIIGRGSGQLIGGGNNVLLGSFIADFATGSTVTNTVAVGNEAGRYAGSGTTRVATVANGIYIGYQSRASADNNTNETVIGYDVVGNGSNSVTLGNTSVTKTILQGNVLIGTTTDGGQKLQVNGNSYFRGTSNDANIANFNVVNQAGNTNFQVRGSGYILTQGVELNREGAGNIYGANTDLYFTGYAALENLRLSFYAGVIVNEGGRSDVNFRVEGDTDANLFFTKASTDNIGMGTNAPVVSALLDMTSTTKGLLPPRMTSAQRAAISTPAVGLVVYQTDGSEGLYENTSTGWRIVNAAGGGSGTVTSVALATGTSGTDINVSGSPITNSGTITLNIPDASTTARGVVTTGSQTFAGSKTFNALTTTFDSGSTGTFIEGRASGVLYGGMSFSLFMQFNAYAAATQGFLWKNGLGDNVMAISQAGQLTVNDLAGTGTRMVVVNSSGVMSTQAIPSGGSLSGTGTTNYLSKWTSSTALGDSLVYDNGTSVGIGTASPSASYKLDVVGGNTRLRATGSDLALLLENANGVATTLTQKGYDGTRHNFILNNADPAGNISFQSNGTTALMVFGSTENVAIGTTTDSGYKLDVNGTARVSSELYVMNSTIGAGAIRVKESSGYGMLVHPSGSIGTYAQYNASGLSFWNGSVAVSVSQIGNGLYFDGSSTAGIYNRISNTHTLSITSGGVSVGSTSNNASAILDVTSTTKGFLPPRMTETQKNAISTPATGLIVYQTDGTAGLYVYTGAAWKSLAIVA